MRFRLPWVVGGQRENERLTKRIAKLEKEPERVYGLLEIQENIAAILGVPLNPNPRTSLHHLL